jgi:integrase
MPIDEYVAWDLLAWHDFTPYKKSSDYVWAIDASRAGAKRGKQPVCLGQAKRDRIQPLARRLGITKKMSWHTFRHTFSSILKANGEEVKMVQELLRHSTSAEHLPASSHSAQASCVEQSGKHDSAERQGVLWVSRERGVFGVTS